MGKTDDRYARKVGDKEQRMLKARRESRMGPLYGLGFFGMVGWAVAMPAALGVLLGVWLDDRRPGGPSWTLTLFAVGLAAGVYTAWRWLSRQRRRIVRRSRDR